MTEIERQILVNQLTIMLALKTLVGADWADLLSQRVDDTNEKLHPAERR